MWCTWRKYNRPVGATSTITHKLHIVYTGMLSEASTCVARLVVLRYSLLEGFYL